jgi:hypothetical protein
LWMHVKDVKELFPFEFTEYAKVRWFLDELTSAWWTQHVLKESAQVLCAAESKPWNHIHRYGIEILRSVRQVKDIDSENGRTP